jgi:hypothetical protein
MEREHDLVPSTRLLRLAARFHDKQYRDAYVAAHAREILAKQMRSFRGALAQAEYAEKIGKQKTVIGRLENPAYSGWSLRTMLDIARKENVAVLARFVDFPTFLNFTDDMSDDALHPQGYNETTTDDIAAYLSRTRTYYDVGGDHFAGGTAMEAISPAPYADIFFGGMQQIGLNLAASGSGNFAVSTYPVIARQSIWLSANTVLGPLTAWEPAPQLPSGMARTQAAIRWLTDLAISRKNQIDALQSERVALRNALAQAQAQPINIQAQPINILPFPTHSRRQPFGNPLDVLNPEAA